jgi:hypothetical protein
VLRKFDNLLVIRRLGSGDLSIDSGQDHRCDQR